MKPIKAFCLSAALVALVPLHAATLWVATDGDNLTGDGTEGNPYLTIQFAHDNASDGDTIRVKEGTYNECVNTFTASVDLVADAFQVPADTSRTVIDGTGQCNFPFASVNISGTPSDPARLEGFTITGGVASGVFARGTVTVTNNLITGNDSDRGGGIYAYSGTVLYGNTQVTITNNVINDNSATDRGGGIYVYSATSPSGDAQMIIVDNEVTGNTAVLGGGGVAVVAGGFDTSSCPGAGCVDDDSRVVVQGNTVRQNTTDDPGSDGFGGGLYVLTNPVDRACADTVGLPVADAVECEIDADCTGTPLCVDLGARISVAVTQNEITQNQVTPATFGYGGGLWVATYGSETERIEVTDNTISQNATPGDGGGVSAWILADRRADHQIRVNDNTLSGNTATGDGGGMDLFLQAEDFENDQSVSMLASNNTVTDNTSTGSFVGGGGILATFESERTKADNAALMEFRLSGNEITGNTAELAGGGMSLWVIADADPEVGAGPILEASSKIELDNNLIAANQTTSSFGDTVGGGMFTFLETTGDATAEAVLTLSTVADNTSELGSGIELEQFVGIDTSGGEGANIFTISSSIITGNDGYGIGGPTAGTPGVIAPGGCCANLAFNVSFSNISNNGSGDIQGSMPQGGHDFSVDDPLLDVVYAPQQCSSALDAADPAIDFSLEPPANGGRANIGHTGGTAAATRSLSDINGDDQVDGIDIVRLSTSFGATPGQPRFLTSADLNTDGLVNGDDLALVGADFGTSCP